MANGTTYIVLPLMLPANSLTRRSRISAGASQLLVGPASASSSQQMNVRPSRRATSLGSERARKPPGGRQGGERPAVDQLLAQPGLFGLAAVAPVHSVGLSQAGYFLYPVEERLVLGRWHLVILSRPLRGACHPVCRQLCIADKGGTSLGAGYAAFREPAGIW